MQYCAIGMHKKKAPKKFVATFHNNTLKLSITKLKKLIKKSLQPFCALGSFINHVVKILGFFDPPPPPSWSLSLNKVIWITHSSLNCPRGLWMSPNVCGQFGIWIRSTKTQQPTHKVFQSHLQRCAVLDWNFYSI